MSEDSVPVLQVSEVAKEFRRGKRPPFLAITDVNATINDYQHSGEFVCLLGPSGCGKSTLLQLIAGFDTHMPPTRGEIRFRGEPVVGPSAERGMLFQDYGCYPHLSVLDNIGFGLALHCRALGLSEKDIRDISYIWLRKVRLRETDAGKYPHELSGGMRQRVALARCLALKPRCLLMDEPFSALDEPTRLGMQDLIVSLWSQIQATIILISHSVAEAVYLGDRIWLMSGAPGTLAAEFVDIPIPDPEVPAMVAQAGSEFGHCVAEIGEVFRKILATPRAAIRPVHADGNGKALCIEGEP